MGLVMDVLKLTLLPLSLPSKISVELPPSPTTLPVSTSPSAFKVTVILRSPRGVCMDTFQVPSVDIRHSSELHQRLKLRAGDFAGAQTTRQILSIVLARQVGRAACK